MGFRDFITNRWFRRSAEAEFARFQNIKPPENPPKRYIKKLVNRLLNENTARDAEKELSLIGPSAVPVLAEALNDERFHQAKWNGFSSAPAPLESVLELLVPHGGDQIIAASTRFVASPSEDVRQTVALHLASLGRAETLPALTRLIQDPDGHVRSYVCMGIGRAVKSERADQNFRDGAHELLLAQCDQDWESGSNECAETIAALNPERAAIDFASSRLLTPENPEVHKIVRACNRVQIILPPELVRSLLDYSLVRAVGERCYPNNCLAAAALESLAMSMGEEARPLLVAALDHEQEEIQESAAKGIANLAGLNDPVGFVSNRISNVCFDGLTPPQRVVYCAAVFEWEVCNGGIMQFFGNTSGDRAFETLQALQTLGHPAAETGLMTAMKLVGPLAREPDRDMRLAACEDRYDELQTAFEPLEEDFYATKGRFMQKILLYAAQNAEHFRESRK